MATPREELERLRALAAQESPRQELERLRAMQGTEQAPAQPKEGFIESVVGGTLEPVQTMLTGAIAEPLAGIAGVGAGMLPGQEGAASQAVESTREGLTSQPTTEAGRTALKSFGEAIEPIVEPITSAIDAAADFVFNETGSPALAAAVKATPTAIAEVLGLKGLQAVRTGTKLINESGEPTQALRKELDKHGLTYENLTPEARASIPDVADPNLLPAPKKEVASAGELALVEQIKSGARDDALAPIKVVNDRIVNDRLGQEALRQGFEPGFVQAVKTAQPQTKQSMKKMLTMMERITKNRRLALDFRPTDIVGQEVMHRLSFIRNKANDARKELDVIARTKLKGAEINPQPIVDKLSESLAELDIDLDTSAGVPKPKFEGSMISKDRTSQRVIRDLIDLMAEGGAPDALRFHKLKRQLDTMIDFRKKSAGGLTDAGKGVLKDIRSSLNQSLRSASDDYARVNDTMSKSLGVMDELGKSFGPSIDMFGEGADKALGTDLRGLLSNRKTRVKLDNALNDLDVVANDLGGKFNVDYKDLSLFANGLEDKFGAVAQSSFKGEIESAIKQTSRGPTEAVTGAITEKVAKTAEALRGVNDFNAFNSMRDLLSEKQ